jgi:hypothetical protein
MNTNYDNLIESISRIARSRKTGSLLESDFLALHLEDPEGPLCRPAGKNEIGRSRCNICPLAENEEAGCMKYIAPIQSALAKKNANKVKVRLERLKLRLEEANAVLTVLQTK